MIKIQNNLPSREPIPDFLVGLAPESLAGLSWTDPALGVQDCAWWPEIDMTPEYDPELFKLGEEVLMANPEHRVVHVSHVVLPLTETEQAARLQTKRETMECSRLQALLAIDQAGLAEAYTAWVSDPARTFREKLFVDAPAWKRLDPVLISAATAFGLSDVQIDQLFEAAMTL